MTNNQHLKQLMRDYQLTATQVAEQIAVSPWTVKNWVRPSSTKGFRKMPDMALRALLMSIDRADRPEPETPILDDDLPDLEFLPAGDLH